VTHALFRAVKAYDIRGVVGEDLDPTTLRALGTAIGEIIAELGADGHRRLAVGHDMRESSPGLAAALAAGAAATGTAVDVIGLCSTDQLYFVSGDTGVAGVMITASHNPARYNGLKLCRAGAKPVSMDTGLAQIRDRAIELLGGSSPGTAVPGIVRHIDTLADYARHLRSLVPLDAVRPLSVVIDAGNGMAGLTAPAVLGGAAGLPALPLALSGLYLDLDGTFPNHEANPLDPTTLVDLQAAVVEQGADIGLAFDGDADRCFFIDERGAGIDPGAVTALVARREIARAQAAGEARPGVLYNLITSSIVPEVVTAAGGSPVRTRVGHSFIKAEMARTGAVFGGEHSAHYYFRDFYGADSGMLAALHVLAALGETPPGTPLSSLVAQYSHYQRSGEINTRVSDVAATTARVAQEMADAAPHAVVDHLDGLMITDSGGGWWVNVRPSNTEPLLRLNVEAKTAADMISLRDRVLGVIRKDGDHV